MSKIRLRAMIVYEYDADPLDYPEGVDTARKMADYDRNPDFAELVFEAGDLVIAPAGEPTP